MTSFTESVVEDAALAWLEGFGYAAEQWERVAAIAGLLDCRNRLLATSDLPRKLLLSQPFNFSEPTNLESDFDLRSSFVERSSKGRVFSQPVHMSLEIIHNPI